MSPVFQFVLSNVAFAFVLGLVVLAVTRIWRNPHLAHALWLLVLLKLVTPPLVKIPVPVLGHGATSETTVSPRDPSGPVPQDSLVLDAGAHADPSEKHKSLVVVEEEATRPAGSDTDAAPDLTLGLTRILMGIWSGGVVLCVLLAWRRHRRLTVLLGKSRPADRELEVEAQELADTVGLRCPEVRISDERVGPLVTAHWLKQTILLPGTLMKELSAEERRAIIAHELAHVHRGDRWIRWFELLVLTLHWWNPGAWWARRRLHAAEEKCCDAWVVWALPGERRSYGIALLRAVEFLTEPRVFAPLASHAGGGPPIKHRIEDIMKNNRHHRMTHAVRLSATAFALTVLPFATTAISQADPASPGAGSSLPERSDLEVGIDAPVQSASGQSEAPKPGRTEDLLAGGTGGETGEWTVFEFSQEAGGAHNAQAAAVVRALAKTNPGASGPQFAGLAARGDAPLEKVHRFSALDRIPEKQVREAARTLRPGQVSRVVQIEERAFVVRRAGTLPSAGRSAYGHSAGRSPYGGHSAGRSPYGGHSAGVRAFSVGSGVQKKSMIAGMIKPEKPVSPNTTFDTSFEVGLEEKAPDGGGTPFGDRVVGDRNLIEAEMGLQSDDPRYKARLRLLELDVKSAEIKRAAAAEKLKLLQRLHEAGAGDTNSQGELTEARLATELAEVEVERARTAVKLFKAEAESGRVSNASK